MHNHVYYCLNLSTKCILSDSDTETGGIRELLGSEEVREC